MADSNASFPKPKYVTGGCLCASLTYRIDFPDTHDFEGCSMTCQCTQDRKTTGSFFLPVHRVPFSAFRWTSPDTATLGHYAVTSAGERGFCTRCGSFLYWRRRVVNDDPDTLSLAVGTIDPLFLFGEGADGTEIPKDGFGVALTRNVGGHEWCGNEIRGVTDKQNMPFLFGGGKRWEGSMS